MISQQTQALWELCKQGYPNCADEAEVRWNAAAPYYPNPEMQLSRSLRVLISQCNNEVLFNTDKQLVN